MERTGPPAPAEPRPSIDIGDAQAGASFDDDLEQQATLCSIEASMFGAMQRITVDRYQLGERLGRGGAGDVYLARDPRLNRDVAIKLLRPHPSLSRARARARFIREARSIAQLSHPNVIKIFDVGEFDRTTLPDLDGPSMPADQADARDVFIVMQRIQGEDLRHWLGRTRPDWRSALSMLLRAGRGLAAAHAEGIVHRDFKPANVLVSDDGAVKVIDFGLAQFVEHPHDRTYDSYRPESISGLQSLASSDHGSLTEAGHVLGTPLYMAPEQHAGQPTGPAADQFALCATLFEAIHGEPAYQGRTHEALFHAKLRGAPLPPAGASVPRRVTRAIERGLHPDPDSRWPSVDALLRALTPSTPQRRPKGQWLWGLAAAATTMVMMVPPASPEPAGCDASERTATVWAPDRRDMLRDQMLATGLPYADDTHAHLTQRVDTYVDQWSQQFRSTCGDDAVVAEQRDQRLLCLSRQLRELDALLEVVGQGDPTALRHATSAAWSLPAPARCDAPAIASSAHAPDPQDTRGTAAVRQGLVELRALRRAGLYEQGEQRGRELTERAEQAGDAALLGSTMAEFGNLQRLAGHTPAARDTLERAYFTASQAHAPQPATNAAIMLVGVLCDLDDADKAAQWARHARASLEQSPDPILEAQLLDGEFGLHLLRREYDAALATSREAMELRRSSPNPLRVAAAHANLAAGLNNTGQHAQALEQVQRAIDLREQQLGARHPAVASLIYNRAETHRKLGDDPAALADYRLALELREQALGPSHPQTGASLHELATMLLSLGELEQAEPLLERAVVIWQEVYGPDHSNVAGTLVNLGIVRMELGRMDQAKRTLERALTRAQAADDFHMGEGLVLHSLASLAEQQGDHATAIERYEQGLALHAERPLPGSTAAAMAVGLSVCLDASGADPSRVRRVAQQAVRLAEVPGAEEQRPEAQQWLDSLSQRDD